MGHLARLLVWMLSKCPSIKAPNTQRVSGRVPDKVEPDDLLYPFDPDFYDLLDDDIPFVSDREHLERAWRLTLAAESNPTDLGGS